MRKTRTHRVLHSVKRCGRNTPVHLYACHYQLTVKGVHDLPAAQNFDDCCRVNLLDHHTKVLRLQGYWQRFDEREHLNHEKIQIRKTGHLLQL